MCALETSPTSALHIGIYGKYNSGKSTLINALTKAPTSMVSEQAGTTTDPIYKTMSLQDIGPCVLIDTIGFNDPDKTDATTLSKIKDTIQKTDIALILFTDEDITEEIGWFDYFKAHHIPVCPIINRSDELPYIQKLSQIIYSATHILPLVINAQTQEGISAVCNMILRMIPSPIQPVDFLMDLIKPYDWVLLVIPSHLKTIGTSLASPHCQALHNLLEEKCLVITCTLDTLPTTLQQLVRTPDLILTGADIFDAVCELKPPSSKLICLTALSS